MNVSKSVAAVQAARRPFASEALGVRTDVPSALQVVTRLAVCAVFSPNFFIGGTDFAAKCTVLIRLVNLCLC